MQLKKKYISNTLLDSNNYVSIDRLPEVNESYDINIILQKLKEEAPFAFELWHKAATHANLAYCGHPSDSCSVNGNLGSELFYTFIKEKIKGVVLDIGCGPQPVPSYLQNYPSNKIVGFDPLSPTTEHPFMFVQGYAEYLPFPDHSFDTIIAATSLDHILIPERAIKEIKRVLRYNGHFLVFEGIIESFQGSFENYTPYADKEITAADQFHLFHFTEKSFLEFLGRHFALAALEIRQGMIFSCHINSR